MGWGSRVHRPASSGAFGGKTARYRPRIVIAVNEVTITSAMTEPFIVLPQYGRDLNYATDLYQRVYCVASTPYQIRKTVTTNGALYSAPSPGSGIPPTEEDSWSIVASSELGVADCNITRHVQQTPSWFSGLSYIDLWTWVYQPSGSWDGEFTVRHELWGNFFRWSRVPHPTVTGIKPDGFIPGVKDTEILILGRGRGN